MLFSNDNASLSVLIFCLIMTLQVIGFNYNIKASQFSLFAYFACLLLGDILFHIIPIHSVLLSLMPF